MLIQVKLQSTNRSMVAWIEKRPTIKKNVRLTLKDDTTIWTVKETYSSIEPNLIHSDWVVGGLTKRNH